MDNTAPTAPTPISNPLALAALALIKQAKRGTPELLELANQVRLTLFASDELEVAAEDAFQEAKQAFAGFHTAAELVPLPEVKPLLAPVKKELPAASESPQQDPALAAEVAAGSPVPPSAKELIDTLPADAAVLLAATAEPVAEESAAPAATPTNIVADDAPPQQPAPAPNIC